MDLCGSGSASPALPTGRGAPPQAVAHLHRNVLAERGQLGGSGQRAMRVSGRVGGRRAGQARRQHGVEAMPQPLACRDGAAGRRLRAQASRGEGWQPLGAGVGLTGPSPGEIMKSKRQPIRLGQVRPSRRSSAS